MDNLRSKLLISTQVIVNLVEEYIPSKFFPCLRLLWEASERAELQVLQSEGTEVAVLEDLMSWDCIVKFVEVFIFEKTQTLLVLTFAEPNL
ncbi:unnamed protein product [Prunus armeniaca]